jgi:predicted nucleic acid-binding protein
MPLTETKRRAEKELINHESESKIEELKHPNKYPRLQMQHQTHKTQTKRQNPRKENFKQTHKTNNPPG